MKEIDWSSLNFGYFPTDYNVRCYFRDGKWGQLEITTEQTIDIHMSATCLHYGQEAFEGMKAFRGKDGRIRLFRAKENAKRMRNSCEGIVMPPVPEELFLEAVDLVVKKNIDFVPPYGSGASLYVRPIMIGLGDQITIAPATEYLFVVFATPVGPYFKEGFKPTSMAIMRGYDRAAPLGTGAIKVGGNYAASFKSDAIARQKGYSAVLYLDSKEKKYIDECGLANFFGIKGNTYITPESTSILPSITNMSLIQIAQDLGMHVERRRISVEELSEFEEAGACGTAAVVSPISQIDDLDNGHQYVYSKDGKAGPKSTLLYNTLRGIQYGDLEDKYGWVTILE